MKSIVLLSLAVASTFPAATPTASSYRMPLVFEENLGQAATEVAYIARGATSELSVTRDGAIMRIARPGQAAAVRMTVAGAGEVRIEPESPLPGKSNYLHGNDPAKWISGVPQYERVRLSGVRPGVDLVFYGSESRIEYDLIVRPGQNPADIRLRFGGQRTMRIGAEGDLVLETAAGEIRHRKPKAWQDAPGGRREVSGRFIRTAPGEVSFRLGRYDRRLPVVIDPVVSYSTYFPVIPSAIAVDGAGNVYVAGAVYSSGGAPPATSGAFDTSLNGGYDVAIAKFDPAGSKLLYLTYLGGDADDRPYSIAVDAAGNAYVSGNTQSRNFPVPPGCLDTRTNIYIGIFVAKLNPSGSSLIQAAVLDGGFQSTTNQLAVDAQGNAYVAGKTTIGFGFPVTNGAYRTTMSGMSEAVVAKLNPSGTALVYATYLGGSGDEDARGITVDSAGSAYVTGGSDSPDFPVTDGSQPAGAEDVFVVKLNPAGTQLSLATRFGGSGADAGTSLVIDGTGSTYVTGRTRSPNFPTTPGAYSVSPGQQDFPTVDNDVFVTKLSPTGALMFSTYLGADRDDRVTGIALDASGNVIVAGYTAWGFRSQFPTTPGALMREGMDGASFVSMFDAQLSTLLYSTLFQGTGTQGNPAMAVTGQGSVYLAVYPQGDMPVTPGAYLTSVAENFQGGLLTRIDLATMVFCTATLSPASASVSGNGASGFFDVVAPAGCPWVARDYSGIAYIGEPATGMGNGRVTYTTPVMSTSPGTTSTTIHVANTTFTLNINSASCFEPALAPASLNFSPAGGAQTVHVVLPNDCSWRADSTSPWLSVTPVTALATADLAVTAQPNRFAARLGSIAINGKPVPVTQAAGACTLGPPPSRIDVPAARSTGSIRFSITGGCNWTAVSQTDWIRLDRSQGDAATPEVLFTVAPNPLAMPRSGVVLIEGQVVNVSQAAGPAGVISSYTISNFAGANQYRVKMEGDGQPALLASLYEPKWTTRDTAGNIIFVDSNTIRKIDTNGIISTIAGGGYLTGENISATSASLSPTAVAVDSSGNLFIAEGSRIRKVTQDGNINTYAGSTINGTSGDGGPASAALFYGASGLAFDAEGNLFVACRPSHKVRRISPGGIVTTYAGTGPPGYDGEGKPAVSSRLGGPTGLSFDAAGNLYISESDNYRVRRVDRQTGLIWTVAGNGLAGFEGDGKLATEAKINQTIGISLDSDGNLYLADSFNARIRKVNPAGIIRTIAGGPAIGYSGDGGPATAALLSGPEGVLALPAGEVLIADTVNFRLRKLSPAPDFCNLSVMPATVALPASGGPVKVQVTAVEGCAWMVTPQENWITVEPATGMGSGSVTLQVAPGTLGGARSATVSIGGLDVLVRQAPGLRFIPMTPCRAVDTRLPSDGPRLESNSRTFALDQGGCAIPTSALAYSVNVTAVPAGPLGYLTLWPAGNPQPLVSTLNALDGRIKAAAAIVEKGPAGGVSVYGSAATDVVIDVNGYFVPAGDPAGLAFYPAPPCRVADTRAPSSSLGGPIMEAAETRNLPVPNGTCGIPASAKAYAVNFTVVPNGPLGYLSAWPTGAAQPGVSTLNALNGGITANAAIVPAGANGSISIYTSAASHVIVDINGYFAPSDGSQNALSFYPAPPCRMVDTRLAAGALGSPSLWGQRTLPLGDSVCGLPANAPAYALNATVVPPGPLGYLTLWPAGGMQPLVSTLNAPDGSITSNAAIVPATSGSVKAFSSYLTDLILDVSGFFAP